MNEVSYDHDFLEHGFSQGGGTLAERFSGHSWVEHWAPLLREEVTKRGDDPDLTDPNAFVMIGVDRDYRQVRHPRDVDAPGVRLVYLGEITHPDR